MKMEAAGSSETLATIYKITLRHISEDSNIHCGITVKCHERVKRRPVARNNACKVMSGHTQHRDAAWIAARKGDDGRIVRPGG
jgi:hypothetical protein